MMQLKTFGKQMKANSSQWQEIIEIRVEMDEIETKKNIKIRESNKLFRTPTFIYHLSSIGD